VKIKEPAYQLNLFY